MISISCVLLSLRPVLRQFGAWPSGGMQGWWDGQLKCWRCWKLIQKASWRGWGLCLLEKKCLNLMCIQLRTSYNIYNASSSSPMKFQHIWVSKTWSSSTETALYIQNISIQTSNPNAGGPNVPLDEHQRQHQISNLLDAVASGVWAQALTLNWVNPNHNYTA